MLQKHRSSLKDWLSITLSTIAIVGGIWAGGAAYTKITTRLDAAEKDVEAAVKKEVLQPQLDQLRADINEIKIDVKELLKNGKSKVRRSD